MAEQQVTPVEARAFAERFAPDPEAFKTLKDEQVLGYHAKLRPVVDELVQSAIKERGEFGPDWRKAIAGEDAAALPTLERFQSPKALWEAYHGLRSKVSAGEFKAVTPYPEKGTAEQQTAWKVEQGLPVKAEDYKIEAPEGIVWGENDKPILDEVTKVAFAKNWTNGQLNDAVATIGRLRNQRVEAEATRQAQLKQETEDKLRLEMKEEYRPTMARIDGVLDSTLPADSPLRAAIKASIETSPEFARWMAGVAFQLNPTSTLVPGGAENQVASITDWLTKADALMRKDRKAYNSSEYSRDYVKYATAYKTHTGKDWGK